MFKVLKNKQKETVHSQEEPKGDVISKYNVVSWVGFMNRKRTLGKNHKNPNK
jgi:hypothetical protein